MNRLNGTRHITPLRIGKRLLVPKDRLIDWIDQNTGGSHVR